MPQVNLLELVRLEGEQVNEGSNKYTALPSIARGHLLPLIYLNHELESDADRATIR